MRQNKQILMLSDISYYTSEALTLLNSLIGIPSVSREEEAAADFLQTYIEESGIMTGRRETISGASARCLIPAARPYCSTRTSIR